MILVVTSFNLRLLARLVIDHLGTTKARVITVVQTSGHSAPRGGSAPQQDIWLADLLRQSKAVIPVSDSVRSALVNLVGDQSQLPPVEIVENGARLSISHPRPRGRRCVSFIGRPEPQKGWPLFVRLVDNLRDTEIRFAANTVSVGPELVPEGVDHSMLLDDEGLLAFFEATDLLVVPYLHGDGLPLAVAEAINCGVPVLGFDAPGVGSLLRRHGQLALPPDYDGLRDAVRAWSFGDLVLEPPVPGAVAGWDEQIGKILAILAATHHVR
jgi:glycosyltransferase involved in cell wall biosynthesis